MSGRSPSKRASIGGHDARASADHYIHRVDQQQPGVEVSGGANGELSGHEHKGRAHSDRRGGRDVVERGDDDGDGEDVSTSRASRRIATRNRARSGAAQFKRERREDGGGRNWCVQLECGREDERARESRGVCRPTRLGPDDLTSMYFPSV